MGNVKPFLSILFWVYSVALYAQIKPDFVTATNLENITYPFPVAYHEISVQGEALKMAYMDVKPETANGKTVALLHGKNFCGAYWGQTASDLTTKGYRVIIPDQIGFGKSSKPENVQYSFQMLAENTKKILDHLQIEKVTVLGHSMGGMLATRFALMYPEATEKLILENPIGLEDWKTVVPYQNVEDAFQSELKQNFETIKNYQLVFYYDNQWKPEYDQWVNILAGWTNNVDYPKLAKNAALLTDMIFTQLVVYEFPNLKMPVLLIIGERDRTAIGKNRAPKHLQETLGNYPVLARQAVKKIPNATLVELKNIGHLPHIEAYDQFITPLLHFLKK